MIPVGIEFREGSCDELVFGEVWVEDVYRMTAIPLPQEGQSALDLGANVGAWTLRAIDRGCEDVVAVEPIPDAVKQMREHLSSWSVVHYVKIIEAACVGVDIDELVVQLGDPRFPSISFQATVDAVAGETFMIVPAIHIDTLLALRPSWWCMKLDVEGAEHSIFEGVDPMLLNRVDYLTMEFHGPGMGDHTAWIDSDWLGALLVKLTEWGSIQTLGAASRGGMIYGWRYGCAAPQMWP